MIVEYFIIMGCLAVAYLPLRLAFLHTFGLPPLPRERSYGGHSLDAATLVDRVQQVREELPTKDSRNQFTQFKRAHLVENKREQMARFSFFQPPPPATPPDPEQEHNPHLLLV